MGTLSRIRIRGMLQPRRVEPSSPEDARRAVAAILLPWAISD